ncbi:DJ-1/PfpI family protein [Sneathiella glossodoripedis]|uniref:DJ-1/PfpI family protein n=1 Tax=Sneathiella glossodoripedis TaxID=418853 RepID=UPI00047213ED|nr:DJ-1/PfpI family protein [Sneathiella glossodoripedis]
MATISSVGIVIFNGIERLDFEGPLGVLGWAGMLSNKQFNVQRISKDGRAVKDHLSSTVVEADASFTEEHHFDLLLVPGGDARQFADDTDLIKGVEKLGAQSRIIASVCTGAFLVAGAGLANNKSIVTHWLLHELFTSKFPTTRLLKDKRFNQDGNLWSSAGISAGVDMALSLVSSEYGEVIAKKCQGFLEYFPEQPWSRDEVAAALQAG